MLAEFIYSFIFLHTHKYLYKDNAHIFQALVRQSTVHYIYKHLKISSSTLEKSGRGELLMHWSSSRHTAEGLRWSDGPWRGYEPLEEIIFG